MQFDTEAKKYNGPEKMAAAYLVKYFWFKECQQIMHAMYFRMNTSITTAGWKD